MKNPKFNTNFSFCGVDIHIHSNSRELFDMAVEYFHKSGSRSIGTKNKRIDFYFEEKKKLPRGRWDLDNWKKETYILESWSRDITVRLNYQKGIIRSYLSSQCKFSKEAIEDLLIFRPLRLMLSKYSFLIIHAGCVVKNGKGILIPSVYAGGKTTTTLNLVRKGFKFLGDEYILLKESNGRIRAHAFPHRIGMKRDLISLFPELKFLHDRKDSPRRKKRFWIDEAYSNATVDSCYPQLIIFPHFKRNSRLILSRVSGSEALFDIFNDRENSVIRGRTISKDEVLRDFNIFSSLVGQAQTYRLAYSRSNLCEVYERLSKIKAKFHK